MSQQNAASDAIAPAVPFAEIRSGNLGPAGRARRKSTPDRRFGIRCSIRDGRRADADTARSQRDKDIYDTVADHLLWSIMRG